MSIRKCPTPESKEWNGLTENEKKECIKTNKTLYTTSFLTFNAISIVLIAVIGGFAFALAMIIITPIQSQFAGFEIYWFALILFAVIIGITVIQIFVNKRKEIYQRVSSL